MGTNFTGGEELRLAIRDLDQLAMSNITNRKGVE